MAEVVIALQRPQSMTASDMHAWLIDRALVRQRALVLSEPEGSRSHGLRLRVEIDDDDYEGAATEGLTNLMMDMRLLGFHPAVLSATRRHDAAGAARRLHG